MTTIRSDAPSLRESPALSVKQKLALFANEVLACLWDGDSDIGADHIQDLAERLGVITEVKFNPRRHSDHLGVGVYPGDPWYVPSRGLKAAVRSAKAAQKGRKDGSSPKNQEPV